MANSSASTCLLLPFGALTGVIPVDAVSRGRVPGEFGSTFPGTALRATEIQQQIHSVIGPEPIVPRCRRPSEYEGRRQLINSPEAEGTGAW